MTLPESTLTKRQTVTFVQEFNENGKRKRITATVRHDDQCGNGHNTFSVTAELERIGNGRPRLERCGCMHDEVSSHFPELAPLIKWHLTSTDGPLHYLQNTLFNASDKDHWGYRKGEVRRTATHITFDLVPVQHKVGKKFGEFLKDYESRPFAGRMNVAEVPHNRDPSTFDPHYTFEGFDVEWHECPFRTEQEAALFAYAMNTCEVRFIEVPTAWGEGKEPDIGAARRSAVWPNAKLEQLTDERKLKARLPALMVRFKRDVESLGLEY